MGSRSHADLLAGAGDAVAALRVSVEGPPSGTAAADRLPSPVPGPPLCSGPVSAWRPPDTIEEYEIEERVGRGGMGEVYRARDTILDRLVAVKLISDIDPDPAARDRFMQEARAAARLSHPNVLTVYRVGEIDGRPYLITEFIAGKTLDEADKPMAWRRVLTLGVGLARGLAAAHRRGVLHRDIKPANAILTNEGEVKLLDFGLAKLLDGAVPPATLRSTPVHAMEASAPRAAAEPTRAPPAALPIGPEDGGSTLVSHAEEQAPLSPGATPPPLTDEGSLMGTPDYMAPEIWRGEPATRRSDVYSLGALLFELCAGRPPHKDLPPRTLPQLVQSREAPRLTDLVPATSGKLAAVIERCLRRDPRERYASGDELREALEQLELTSRSGSIPEGNPYRGLSTFEAEHRSLFFGRGAEVGTLIERLRSEPLVIVAGASGVGKSSLCRAGVLCAVQDGALAGGRAWSVIRFVPGRSPLLSFGAALAPMLGIDESAVVRRLRSHPNAIARTLRKRLGDTAGLVVFIDQLEELVTMSERGGALVAAEALGHLAAGLPGLRLLMTLRSDFLAPVAALPGLGDEIARALYFLKPLSPDGVRRAIVGPAHATGATFESEALVDTLVEATSEAEGGLPLLQFALAELWEARDQAAGAITAAALSRIGGVSGALARHADEVILGMTAVQRSAARRVLFALVSRQGTPVRRREDELVAGDTAARAALNGLVRGRLVVVRDAEEGPTYELAHEALIRGWATLRRWLDEQAEGRAVRQRLATAATEWERLGRAPELLWGVRQLTELTGVVDLDDLHPRETAFVSASRRRVDRQKIARTVSVAAIPVAAVFVWGGEQIYAQHDTDRKVAVLLNEADGDFALARRDDDRSAEKRKSAYGRFDSFDRELGEADWAEALALTQAADQRYGRAAQTLETALRVDPTSAEAERRLGDVLYARLLLAEQGHHPQQRADLLSRLALYDPGGIRRARLAEPARLSIQSAPAGAAVTLLHYVEDDKKAKRLVKLADLGATPLADPLVLPPGSYMLTFDMPGRAETRYPILVGRSERFDLKVLLPEAARVPEGFVYVAAGRFLFGSAAEEEARRTFYTTAPLHETTTGPYLIAREETTYADWIEFLRALPPEERARRAQQVRSLTGGIELKELPDDSFQLTLQPTTHVYVARAGEKIHYEARARRADQDWLRFPVLGVSSEDAEGYVAWLSASGRVPGARLCTEKEWERAARGADARDYPHGDHLEPDDANLDLTYGKEPLAFGPDEVGSHPSSRSPFGVDDLCGNAWEWTKSSLATGEHVLRGGGYYFDPTTSRIPNRQIPEPTIHDANLGLRVCVTFDP